MVQFLLGSRVLIIVHCELVPGAASLSEASKCLCGAFTCTHPIDRRTGSTHGRADFTTICCLLFICDRSPNIVLERDTQCLGPHPDDSTELQELKIQYELCYRLSKYWRDSKSTISILSDLVQKEDSKSASSQ